MRDLQAGAVVLHVCNSATEHGPSGLFSNNASSLINLFFGITRSCRTSCLFTALVLYTYLAVVYLRLYAYRLFDEVYVITSK